MTGIRRTLILIGLTVAVVIGASVPASAGFERSVPVGTTTVGTGTVAAPAAVWMNDYCWTQTNYVWNATTLVYDTTYSYLYSTTVSWPASGSRGVSGYRIMAHLNTGQSFVMGETDAATRSVSATVDQWYLNYQPRVSILTLTSYGWTAETALTAVLTC
jgi:hypothetical protein